MRSDWFEWSRVADIKPYLNIVCVLFMLFFAKMLCAMLRKRFDGDSEVNWRYNMPSNIVYAYIKKGVMLDKLDITLLLNSESLSNRLWWFRKTEFERNFLNIEWIQIVQKQHIRCFVESHTAWSGNQGFYLMWRWLVSSYYKTFHKDFI